MSPLTSELINIGISAIAIPAIYMVFTRLTKRLENIERTQAKHTTALARQGDGMKQLIRTVRQNTDDTEELEEITNELKTDIRLLKQVNKEHAKFKREMSKNRRN